MLMLARCRIIHWVSGTSLDVGLRRITIAKHKKHSGAYRRLSAVAVIYSFSDCCTSNTYCMLMLARCRITHWVSDTSLDVGLHRMLIAKYKKHSGGYRRFSAVAVIDSFSNCSTSYTYCMLLLARCRIMHWVSDTSLDVGLRRMLILQHT